MTGLDEKEVVESQRILELLFAYMPMFGLVIAFKQFDYTKGILGSSWNFPDNFKLLVVNKDKFLTIYGNIFRTLTTEVMEKKLDELVAIIEPEMKMHWDTWGPKNDKSVIFDVPTTPEGAYRYWEQRVNRLRNVIRKRPTRLWDFTQDAFNLTDNDMNKYFGPRPEMPANVV